MIRRRPLALALLALSVPACDLGPADDDAAADDAAQQDMQQTDDPELLADLAVESGDGVSGESALVATIATDAAASGANDAEGLAEAAADPTSLTAMCAYGGTVTATREGNEVTFSFLACSSHCGMHRATGDVVVEYTALEDGIGVDITADEFRIDGTTSDLDLSAQYRQQGATALMSVDAHTLITGWFGYEIERTGQYDASFDAAALCITHDGEWTTRFGQHEYATTLADYRRCALQCPDPGSRVSFEAEASGFSFDAEMTSADTLTWSTSTGASGELTLASCGE